MVNVSASRRLAVSVAAALLLCGGCGLGGMTQAEEAGEPTATSGESPPASPTPSEEQTPTPSPPPSPTSSPTAPAEPLPPVWLTADTVGTVELRTEDPLPSLLRELGAPDSYTEVGGICATPGTYAAAWGDLEVFLDDGTTLLGWAVLGPQLPANVRPPHGLVAGAAVEDVRALPDAEDVVEEDLHTYGQSVLADGISWYHDDETVSAYGVNLPYCGSEG